MKSEFKQIIRQVESFGAQYLLRFTKHPYLGYEHHSSIFDVGTVRTSFEKIESKRVKQELRDNFPKKYMMERYGMMIGVENPMKEIRWTMMVISEFDIHFINAVLPLGFSVSTKSIKNIDIKEKRVMSEVTFECEIINSSYKEIPLEKMELTIKMGKNIAKNFLTFVKAFQVLEKRIEDNKVFMFSVHTNGVKKNEKDPNRSNPATKNYVINCTYYVDTELGEILLGRPSNGTFALAEYLTSPFLETLEKFDKAIRDKDLLTGLNQRKLLDHSASDLVDIIIVLPSKYGFEGEKQTTLEVIKGEENYQKMFEEMENQS